jgi:hypothetical protein
MDQLMVFGKLFKIGVSVHWHVVEEKVIYKEYVFHQKMVVSHVLDLKFKSKIVMKIHVQQLLEVNKNLELYQLL